MHRRLILIALVIVVVAAGIWIALRGRPATNSLRAAQAALVDQSTLAAWPHVSASSADMSHLDTQQAPPTNTWFSGMVLQAQPMPVYPTPISFLAKNNGFEIGLPDVHSTSAQISGAHVVGLQFNTPADSFTLTRYDKLSVTLIHTVNGRPLGTTTITEGSPFVFYEASAAHTVTIPGINPADIQERSSHYIRYVHGSSAYALNSEDAPMAFAGSTITIPLSKGNLVTVYALPGSHDDIRPYASNRIEATTIEHAVSGGTATTTINITTANHQPTILALPPYEPSDNNGRPLSITYQSIWGTMKVYKGVSFITTNKRIVPQNELDLSKISDTQRKDIIATLPGDVAATNIDAQDSYYAGKQLARAANLLSIAEQLHQTDSAKQLLAKLNAAFKTRLHGTYFYYDTKLKGIAATKAAFGSEDFNDHHFHYGYWLYAASIVAKYDSAFLHSNANQLNLLAADIASPVETNQFPAYRNYDPYAEHSWAAGLAPFSDGNNQESSSEAIHAWNGVTLWGKVTGNSGLEQTGEWMLTNESNTAQKAWRSVDTSNPALHNYTSPVASLNFGGKRTYDTFFSAEPSAKLGIQLIPMDPSMQSFRTDTVNIQMGINKTIQADNYNIPLGDYVLMYLSLSDPTQAQKILTRQSTIDDGDSLSYLKAFIDVQ